jgi:hypothetical protein
LCIVAGSYPVHQSLSLLQTGVRFAALIDSESGMTAPNFAFGVVNALATAFVLGAHPEYYWLYYAVQATVLLTVRTVSWFRLKLQCYLLDFCWVFNYILCLLALLAAFALLRSSVRRHSNPTGALWCLRGLRVSRSRCCSL